MAVVLSNPVIRESCTSLITFPCINNWSLTCRRTAIYSLFLARTSKPSNFARADFTWDKTRTICKRRQMHLRCHNFNKSTTIVQNMNLIWLVSLTFADLKHTCMQTSLFQFQYEGLVSCFAVILLSAGHSTTAPCICAKISCCSCVFSQQMQWEKQQFLLVK